MESNWDLIRPEIEKRIVELRNADSYDPQTLALKVVELSAWLASANREVAERKYWYHVLLKEMLDTHKSANKAVIYAGATKEWRDYEEATAYAKSLLEIIRSERRYSRLVEGERNEARY